MLRPPLRACFPAGGLCQWHSPCPPPALEPENPLLFLIPAPTTSTSPGSPLRLVWTLSCFPTPPASCPCGPMKGAALGTCAHSPWVPTGPRPGSALQPWCRESGDLPGCCPLAVRSVGRWAQGEPGETSSPPAQSHSLSGHLSCPWLRCLNLQLPTPHGCHGQDQAQWGPSVEGCRGKAPIAACCSVSLEVLSPQCSASLASAKFPVQIGSPAALCTGWSQISAPAFHETGWGGVGCRCTLA